MTPLQNWNVLNGENFEEMLGGNGLISDALKNWNISNNCNICRMFKDYSYSIVLKPLDNWKISKVKLIYLKHDDYYYN